MYFNCLRRYSNIQILALFVLQFSKTIFLTNKPGLLLSIFFSFVIYLNDPSVELYQNDYLKNQIKIVKDYYPIW